MFFCFLAMVLFYGNYLRFLFLSDMENEGTSGKISGEVPPGRTGCKSDKARFEFDDLSLAMDMSNF